MFKVIKRILVFIMAAFVALFLFACVDVIVNPVEDSNTTQEESTQQEEPTQEEIEKAKADAELKKKEQKEREKEATIEASAPSEQDKAKLVDTVDSLIPSIYKEKSTYDVYASTPTDKSIKGLFLTIQPVNTNFTNEKYCKYAAVEILENIKNVKDINKITFDFVDAYNIRYKLTIEDWASYKEKGISEKTLKLIKVD